MPRARRSHFPYDATVEYIIETEKNTIVGETTWRQLHAQPLIQGMRWSICPMRLPTSRMDEGRSWMPDLRDRQRDHSLLCASKYVSIRQNPQQAKTKMTMHKFTQSLFFRSRARECHLVQENNDTLSCVRLPCTVQVPPFRMQRPHIRRRGPSTHSEPPTVPNPSTLVPLTHPNVPVSPKRRRRHILWVLILRQSWLLSDGPESLPAARPLAHARCPGRCDSVGSLSRLFATSWAASADES